MQVISTMLYRILYPNTTILLFKTQKSKQINKNKNKKTNKKIKKKSKKIMNKDK